MTPIWKHLYANLTGLIENARYEDIKEVILCIINVKITIIHQMCDDIDNQIIQALYKAGGAEYATFTSLAWRYY